MTKDELNRWAEEKAQTLIADDLQYEVDDHDAPVIAAALVEAYGAGQRDSGERAAAICDGVARAWSHHAVAPAAAKQCASAIRAAMEEGKP